MKFYSVLTWILYFFTLMLMVVLSGCAIYPVDNGIDTSVNRDTSEVTNSKPSQRVKNQFKPLVPKNTAIVSKSPVKKKPIITKSNAKNKAIVSKSPVAKKSIITKSNAKNKVIVSKSPVAKKIAITKSNPISIVIDKPKPYIAHNVTHKILFIGDSHSNTNFGKILTNLLKKTPAHVTTVASCGSSPSWWLQGRPTHCGFWRHNANGSEEKNLTGITPKITKLMDIVKPDMVVVALGTNLIPENSIERRKYAEALMQLVTQNSQQCFWIGPPDARKFSTNQINNVYKLLAELASKHNCHLIDSRHYTSYPTSGGDGIHYSGKLGKNTLKTWAKGVWDNIYTSLMSRH